MSLAVLVDQELTWTPDKSGFRRVLVPPSPEKLKVLHDLVAGITGFNAERGDQLVIETLPFESTLLLEPPSSGAPAPSSAPEAPRFGIPGLKLDKRTVVIAGAAAAGLVLLASVLLFLLRRKKPNVVQVSGPAELPSGASAPSAALPPAAGNIEDQIDSQFAQRAALQQKMEAQALSALKLAPVITKTAEVLAKHLREKISKEPDVAAQVLRTWIREEEER